MKQSLVVLQKYQENLRSSQNSQSLVPSPQNVHSSPLPKVARAQMPREKATTTTEMEMVVQTRTRRKKSTFVYFFFSFKLHFAYAARTKTPNPILHPLGHTPLPAQIGL